jgi:hypothetical protein
MFVCCKFWNFHSGWSWWNLLGLSQVVPETSAIFNQLTRLVGQEDIIMFSSGLKFLLANIQPVLLTFWIQYYITVSVEHCTRYWTTLESDIELLLLIFFYWILYIVVQSDFYPGACRHRRLRSSKPTHSLTHKHKLKTGLYTCQIPTSRQGYIRI